MATEDCHVISRFLTEPWEFDSHKGKRRLRFFDIESQIFDDASSKTLLTVDKAFSQDVENFLNRYVESPFSMFRKSILINPANTQIRKYQVLRSIYLMVILQSSRVSASRSGEVYPSIEDLGKKDEGFINGLVETMRPGTQIITVYALPQECLYMPDIGYFSVWLKDGHSATGFSVGWFIPIHPTLCLGIVSESADKNYLDFLRKQPGFFPAASCSFSVETKRIILPEEAYQNHSTDELKERFNKMRQFQIDNNQKHLQVCALVNEMYSIAGLSVRDSPHSMCKVSKVFYPDGTIAPDLE